MGHVVVVVVVMWRWLRWRRQQCTDEWSCLLLQCLVGADRLFTATPNSDHLLGIQPQSAKATYCIFCFYYYSATFDFHCLNCSHTICEASTAEAEILMMIN